MWKKILGAIIALTVIILTIVVIARSKKSPIPAPLPTAVCSNPFVIKGHNGFAAGLDGSVKATVNQIRAVELDPFKYIPMTQLEMFHLEEDVPFLWMTPDRKEAVVDQRFFSDLAVIEVVGGLPQETQIGLATPELLRRMPLPIITRFLLQSEIIQTYWHLKAELCPVSENQTADLYEQNFQAQHSYCTNECVTQPYTFTVRINKRTGAITVR